MLKLLKNFFSKSGEVSKEPHIQKNADLNPIERVFGRPTCLLNDIEINTELKLGGKIEGYSNVVKVGGFNQNSKLRIDVFGNNNRIELIGGGRLANLHIVIGSNFEANNCTVFIDEGYTCGNGVKVLVYSPKSNVNLGKGCLMESNSVIQIGNYPRLVFDQNDCCLENSSSIEVESDVWIKQNSYLYKNTSILSGSIVEANSVLTDAYKSQNALIAGNPARVVTEGVSWVQNPGKLKHGDKKLTSFNEVIQTNNRIPLDVVKRVAKTQYEILHSKEGIKFSEYVKGRAKIYDERIIRLEDKVLAKEFVQKMKLPVAQSYYTLDNVDDLVNVDVPENCVIKFNNLAGSNGVVIRENGKYKKLENLNDVIGFLKAHNQQGPRLQESDKWIPQKLLVEELLFDSEGGEDLQDWKMYCFYGKVEYVFMTTNLVKERKWRHYTRDFERIHIQKRDDDMSDPGVKPEFWDKIVEMAEKLSMEYCPDTFVRIDFFSTTKGPVFGEFSFNPNGGNDYLEEADILFGNLISSNISRD